MELAGLILALVVTLFVAYAVPLWSKRRYALVSARSEDRFSQNLMLIETSAAPPEFQVGPSSRPILQNASIPAVARGNAMSELKQGESPRPERPRAKVQTADAHSAREYAALRAQRAARVSRETVAAKRRLLTAGLGGIALITFAILAFVGVVGWLWLLLPAGFLAATLVASAIAGERTKKQTESENRRMADLRDAMKSPRKVRQPSVVSVRMEDSQVSSVATREDKSAEVIEAPAPRAELTASKPARSEVSDSASTHSAATPVLKASGAEWDYVPLPKPSYARKETIRARVVHADTDIVSVRPLKDVVVPGRPTRATTPTRSDIVDTSTASNPTFKFDLDAVLEHRRAQ